MKGIIRKTFTLLFAICLVSTVTFAQASQKIEPINEKSNKIEIKTDKEIKDANILNVSDDKVITKAKSHDCSHSKECKVENIKNTTMNSKDCCKDKSTTMNSKDCCKDKSTTMNSKDCSKDKSTTMNSKDCSVMKSTSMNTKDCCKDKSNAMKSIETSKVKDLEKTEIKVAPETK